jgi:hypothetical protein
MLAAHSAPKGFFCRVGSLFVGCVNSLQQLSVLIAANKILQGKDNQATARDFITA